MRKYIPSNATLVPSQAELVFEGKIFNVYQWPQKLFDGTTETFEMISRKDTVTIIGIKDGKIVITRQKQPRKDWFYDLPGGRNDNPGEDELAAAKREMLEETGMTFRNWRLIEAHQPQAKIDWLVYTFLATDFDKQVAQNLDGGEQVEVIEMGFDELKSLIASDKSFRSKAVFKQVGSLDELMSLPALYEY